MKKNPDFPWESHIGRAFDDLDIARDHAPVSADGAYYVSAPDSGFHIVLSPDKVVRTIVLHSEGADGYRAFRGPLAEAFSFALNRDKVRDLFGAPDKSAEASGSGIFASPNALDTYFTCETYITISYNLGLGSVNTISIGLIEQ
jgi:hypothetical protein